MTTFAVFQGIPARLVCLMATAQLASQVVAQASPQTVCYWNEIRIEDYVRWNEGMDY